MSLTVPSQDAGWRVEVDAVEDSTHGVDLVAALSAATAALAASPGSTITVERDVVLELQGSTPQGGDLSLPRGSFYRVVVDGSSVMQTRDDLAAAVIEALNRKVANPSADVRVVHDMEIIVDLLPAPPSTQEIAVGMAVETDTALGVAASGGGGSSADYVWDWDQFANTAALDAGLGAQPDGSSYSYKLFGDSNPGLYEINTGVGQAWGENTWRIFWRGYPYAGGDQQTSHVLTVPPAIRTSEWWIEIPLRYQDGFSVNSDHKTFFFNTNNSGGQSRWEWRFGGFAIRAMAKLQNDTIAITPASVYEGSGELDITNYLPISNPGTPLVWDGQWHIVRLHMKTGPDGIFEAWLDGVQLISRRLDAADAGGMPTSEDEFQSIEIFGNGDGLVEGHFNEVGRYAIYLTDPGW